MMNATTGVENVSRRSLVKGLVALGAVGAAGGAFSHAAFAEEDETMVIAANESSQMGFVMDVNLCVNCGSCASACRNNNKTPDDLAARRVVAPYQSSFKTTAYVSYGCMHCEDPSCAKVCPAKAIVKGEGGIVSVDSDRCIGCKYCYQACPFGIPHYGPQGMDKCDCCTGIGVEIGQKPHCVRACITGALKYGRIDELIAESHGTAYAIEAPGNPSYAVK